MFSIYSTEKALEDICLGVKYPNWNAIAKKQNEIMTNATDDNLLDSENPLTIFSQMYGISFVSCVDYLNRINNDSKAVLENPCGAFILDINGSTAEQIEKDFGVICQSDSSIDDKDITCLLCCNKEILVEKDSSEHYWESFLDQAKIIPSNSLIINDRYLFKNDNSLKKEGVNNALDIINSILPNLLTCEYHILIVMSELKDGITLSQMATWLKKEAVKLRNYPILVEIIQIQNNSCPHYDKTHNRRIVTNYSVIRAEHKFQTFVGRKGACDQTLNFDTLYSRGINDNSDCPEKNHRKVIKITSDIANHGKSNPNGGYYAYASNGKCKDFTAKDIDGKYKDITAKDIKNRLLK